MKSNTVRNSEGNARMPPSLIHAAEHGDIDEGIQALNHNKDCIHEYNYLRMNALQVAMVNFHKDFGLF